VIGEGESRNKKEGSIRKVGFAQVGFVYAELEGRIGLKGWGVSKRQVGGDTRTSIYLRLGMSASKEIRLHAKRKNSNQMEARGRVKLKPLPRVKYRDVESR